MLERTEDIVIRTAYVISVVLLIMGALFKIQHWPYAMPILIAGGIAGFVFSILSMAEIFNSVKPMWYKVSWIIAFILPMLVSNTILYLIVSVIYIQHRRKRVMK